LVAVAKKTVELRSMDNREPPRAPWPELQDTIPSSAVETAG
jgi:hypothetical protein